MAETPLRSVGFSGHETFPFRNGWIKKGFDAVTQDGTVFNQERAPLALGVGKNMVRSIRHWCLATGVSKEAGRGNYSPSEFGILMLSDNGFDPYMEDINTLWLLHWRIATNFNRCTSWYWAFGFWHRPEFDRRTLVREIEQWLIDQSYTQTSHASLVRDIDCFSRMYAPTLSTAGSEESLDCPLAELNLVTYSPQDNLYRFNRGDKPDLAPEIFAYALLDFWEQRPTQTTLSLEEIAYAPGSPGRIFQLDENAVMARLECVSEIIPSIAFVSSGGIKQLIAPTEFDFQGVRTELLGRYFGGME